MAAVVTRRFGEEAFQFVGKKVAVETSDNKVYNGTLAGIDDKLDIVLDNVEGRGILKMILNGAFIREGLPNRNPANTGLSAAPVVLATPVTPAAANRSSGGTTAIV